MRIAAVVVCVCAWSLACADPEIEAPAPAQPVGSPAPAARAPSGAPSPFGTWVYKDKGSKMREELLVYAPGDEMQGVYAGQERAEGSVMYYQAPASDLVVSGNSVSFKVGSRTLFDAPQATNGAPAGKEVGMAAIEHSYTGTIDETAGTLTLTCTPECVMGDGPAVFRRD